MRKKWHMPKGKEKFWKNVDFLNVLFDGIICGWFWNVQMSVANIFYFLTVFDFGLEWTSAEVPLSMVFFHLKPLKTVNQCDWFELFLELNFHLHALLSQDIIFKICYSWAYLFSLRIYRWRFGSCYSKNYDFLVISAFYCDFFRFSYIFSAFSV